jgi:hypothetical protein
MPLRDVSRAHDGEQYIDPFCAGFGQLTHIPGFLIRRWYLVGIFNLWLAPNVTTQAANIVVVMVKVNVNVDCWPGHLFNSINALPSR